MHHSTILTEKNPTRCNSIKILLFLILNEAQHVSGTTPPIIRSLKLHKQPLVHYADKVQEQQVQQPSTISCKTRGCLCSFRLLMMSDVAPETCWASFKIRNNKILINCCILLGFSLQEFYRKYLAKNCTSSCFETCVYNRRNTIL